MPRRTKYLLLACVGEPKDRCFLLKLWADPPKYVGVVRGKTAEECARKLGLKICRASSCKEGVVDEKHAHLSQEAAILRTLWRRGVTVHYEGELPLLGRFRWERLSGRKDLPTLGFLLLPIVE